MSRVKAVFGKLILPHFQSSYYRFVILSMGKHNSAGNLGNETHLVFNFMMRHHDIKVRYAWRNTEYETEIRNYEISASSNSTVVIISVWEFLSYRLNPHVRKKIGLFL